MTVKIRQIAAEMGYRVNPTARALRAGATRLIGMVVPVIGIPFFAQLVDAIEEQLSAADYELLLADSHGFVEEEDARIQVLQDRGVDGIIIIPADRTASIPTLKRAAAATKIVQVDRAAGEPIADFIGVDNHLAMTLIFNHLTERGVREIAYVGADDASTNGVERASFVRALAAERGIEVTVEFRSEFSVSAGRAGAIKIMGAAHLPHAVIAASDQLAVGVIAQLREAGVNVPGDILVTGFDGGELSQVYWPSLTTVVQPVEAIAAETVSSLLARIKKPETPLRRALLAPTLQIGESTAT